MAMERPKCPKCNTTDGLTEWVGDENGYYKECNYAWHDKDRDPYRYSYPDDNE